MDRAVGHCYLGATRMTGFEAIGDLPAAMMAITTPNVKPRDRRNHMIFFSVGGVRRRYWGILSTKNFGPARYITHKYRLSNLLTRFASRAVRGMHVRNDCYSNPGRRGKIWRFSGPQFGRSSTLIVAKSKISPYLQGQTIDNGGCCFILNRTTFLLFSGINSANESNRFREKVSYEKAIRCDRL